MPLSQRDARLEGSEGPEFPVLPRGFVPIVHAFSLPPPSFLSNYISPLPLFISLLSLSNSLFLSLALFLEPAPFVLALHSREKRTLQPRCTCVRMHLFSPLHLEENERRTRPRTLVTPAGYT